MKKVFVLFVVMALTSQLFAQAGKRIEFENGKKIEFENAKKIEFEVGISTPTKFDHKWPPYRSYQVMDSKTGELRAFEYRSDYVIDAPEVCGPLGVKSLIIPKGQYQLVRPSANEGGLVTFAVSRWTPVIPKPQNLAKTISVAEPTPFTVTPIFENGTCKALRVQFLRNGAPPKQGF